MENLNYSKEILKKIWNYLIGKITDDNFEKWIFKNYDELKEIFDQKSFHQLTYCNFVMKDEVSSLQDLLIDFLKKAIRSNYNCECIHLLEETIVDQRFIEELIVNPDYPSAEIVIFVEKRFLASCDILMTGITKFSKYLNQPLNNEEFYTTGETDFFTDSTLYKCKVCDLCWLVTYNASNVYYILNCLSKREAKNVILNNIWPERFDNKNILLNLTSNIEMINPFN